MKKEKPNTEIKKNDIIADILLESQKNIKGICCVLSGNWGCGKTWRWNAKENSNSIDKKLKTIWCRRIFTPNPIYISMFGKTTLSDVKLSLLDKIIKTKNYFVILCTWLTMSCIVLLIVFGLLSSIVKFEQSNKVFYSIIKFTDFNMVNIGIILVVLVFLSAFFYKSLVKFFSNKILGVDHNNIDFKTIWKCGKKPVLCFDDIERMGGADLKSLLGFFEELKNIGFPILLLTHSKNESFDNGTWKEYKEKLVDRSFEQPINIETLESVLKKYEKLDEYQKKYIKAIYGNLYNFEGKSNDWEEEDLKLIKQVKNNFRFIEHIIRNIIFVCKNLSNYNELSLDEKELLFSYIGVWTTIQFLEYDYKYEDSKSKENSKETQELNLINIFVGRYIIGLDEMAKARFGKLFFTSKNIYSINNSFSIIRKLLLTGEKTENKINFSITGLTEIEAMASNFSVWDHTTPVTKTHTEEFYSKLISKDTSFLSFQNFSMLINHLAICNYFIGKDFKESDYDEVLKIMKKFVDNETKNASYYSEDFNALIHLSDYSDEKTSYAKTVKYLNEKYKEFGLGKNISEIKKDGNFFNNLLESINTYDFKYYIHSLIINKDKQDILFNMKTDDSLYLTYRKVMRNVCKYIKNDNSVNELKKIDENLDLEAFLEVLRSEANALKDLPGAGHTEKQLADDLLNSLK